MRCWSVVTKSRSERSGEGAATETAAATLSLGYRQRVEWTERAPMWRHSGAHGAAGKKSASDVPGDKNTGFAVSLLPLSANAHARDPALVTVTSRQG